MGRFTHIFHLLMPHDGESDYSHFVDEKTKAQKVNRLVQTHPMIKLFLNGGSFVLKRIL